MKKKKLFENLSSNEPLKSRNIPGEPSWEFTSRNSEFSKTLQLLNRFMNYPERSSGFPIMLIGPVGAGKTLIARTFAKIRNRYLHGGFVEIPCGAIRGDEFHVSFFPGSFSKFHEEQTLSENSLRSRVATWENVLDLAGGGVLFMKEIALLSRADQELLLHFLDTQNSTARPASLCVIASSSLDLHALAKNDLFSPALLAALSVWALSVPPLAQRPEDIPDLIQLEIEQWKVSTGQNVSFNENALEKFLRFAESTEAVWSGNLRDLRAALFRMISLSKITNDDVIISSETVSGEITRLKHFWEGKPPVIRQPLEDETDALDFARRVMGENQWNQLDRFAKTQLADVLLVCRKTQSLSEAGRILFSSSRLEKSTTNDTDRLRKYLLKFGISWNDIQNVPEKTF